MWGQDTVEEPEHAASDIVSLSSHFSNIHTFPTAQAGIELKEMLTTRVLRILSSKVTEDLGKEQRKLDLQRAALTVVWQAAAGGPTTFQHPLNMEGCMHCNLRS